MKFKSLHYKDQPLLICNVWDARSAKIAEQLGFEAIGTSSAAIADAIGTNDGEMIDFDKLLVRVKEIKDSTKLPLTVDIEGGYSRDLNQITDNIQTLEKMGVSGINIEDSLVDNDLRVLVPNEAFADILCQVVKGTSNTFINARVDTYVTQHHDALGETIRRIAAYENQGIHGVFIPGLKDPNEIETIVNCTQLPVNVMALPGLPEFKSLQELGVKRISMGNFIYEKMNDYLSQLLEEVKTEGSFQPVFS